MTRSRSFQAVAPSHFLIIGFGNERRGDDAVGPRVADIVDSWHLSSLTGISVPQLTPDLVHHIARTDYVIFVEAGSNAICAPTVQLDPIVVGNHSPRTLATQDANSCNPMSLLNLAQRRYGRKPQAWFLQVPIESFDLGADLSSTTKRGCDQAVRTIEQFLRTYQKPIWMNQAAYRESV